MSRLRSVKSLNLLKLVIYFGSPVDFSGSYPELGQRRLYPHSPARLVPVVVSPVTRH